MPKPETHRSPLEKFTPDDRNANRHTERGLGMLDTSMRRFGAGRSILVDRNGKVIAGNATLERAVDLGLTDAIVVPTDGRSLVVVQRMDLDLDTDAEARGLAVADNRAAQVDLEWDGKILAALSEIPEVGVRDFFTREEIMCLIEHEGNGGGGSGEPSADRAWKTAKRIEAEAYRAIDDSEFDVAKTAEIIREEYPKR